MINISVPVWWRGPSKQNTSQCKMKEGEVKKRIEKLKKVIDHYRYLYHVKNISEISEEALDSLKDELFKLEEEYPQFKSADSPTQRVAGRVLEGFKKVKHKVPQ